LLLPVHSIDVFVFRHNSYSYSQKVIDEARLVVADKNYRAAWRWVHDQAGAYFTKVGEEEEEEKIAAEEEKRKEREKKKLCDGGYRGREAGCAVLE
jgi:hypothetical protein